MAEGVFPLIVSKTQDHSLLCLLCKSGCSRLDLTDCEVAHRREGTGLPEVGWSCLVGVFLSPLTLGLKITLQLEGGRQGQLGPP